ncbi:TetR/AcrR family transcriptional regulator [Schumannella sp. 10F1B-5-1]|uniref:TetR/AcrR family transcriptional regulator n=1 Tax=Schumannella sp. 10F1B-5-1 TaxID=2590780 RepID=UPI00113290C9|nr:TetR/AcrR family transcriptional regulator [Schumannella sp. 10F1B-5-1]TPW73105.1 TetR/AcrR family transcriptional regulator [Schumannella sp. 10F1B-5-1]
MVDSTTADPATAASATAAPVATQATARPAATADAPPTPRRRADAQRNRDALVEAARSAFTEGGADASLEAIARRAGVGIGTLYRHFPTRSSLVSAVHESGIDALTASVEPLLAEHPPAVALRRWLDGYTEFFSTKRGMAEALREAADAGALSPTNTHARVTASIDALLSAGKDAGEIRDDARADDVTTALVGVFLSTRDAADPAQVGRLVELVLAGIRA